MQLIGMMDSPYVRRVAISLHVLGLPFEHRSVSVFRHFDEFAKINPVVKAPTLVDDGGAVLVDSTLILDYLDRKVPAERRLLPEDLATRTFALRVVGFGLAAAEKTVQQVYERELRPAERQHEPWFERVRAQMHAAYGVLEQLVASRGDGWLCADRITQADITAAVAWRFTQYMLPGALDAVRYPALTALSARLEALPEFVATPLE
ncbi:glutathione S-transferase family protein [Paraburkholderia caballeronis]|uniref:Glutathione S-transferase n=1 Tax=Paraburkholderia caballeronis TaxID=416943 RepID=A0A1H7MZP0_9BURK|nr:glutathione S-transferase family protein [Paraburkholderia caballeronis]PXW26340.1 glutathione S-transferase [Paraburkholderia caballeronis]PXX01887.1 glutathione S-transferase [Paraburkholderia caballeronis]RAK01044.1 glutathione S-transferase [Paraburkholderia caballeronis]SEC01145.1 Glutathione S-transferase [Paraburkholderia caballeronis]SEL16529.1 Glutathione S-transferase [Paraburkholderia caballeronis]